MPEESTKLGMAKDEETSSMIPPDLPKGANPNVCSTNVDLICSNTNKI